MTSINLSELMLELRKLDIKLWLEDGRLHYRAPKGVLTPSLRQTLTERKDDIVLFLLGFESNKKDRSIVPVSRDRSIPLSFAQERLWFLNQLVPDSTAYNILSTLRVKGYLNEIVVEQCLNELIRRHEVLRTGFSVVDGQPIQVIDPALRIPLHVIDLSAIPSNERETEARKLTAKEVERTFDLTRTPLLNATLLKLGEGDSVLIMVLHHIISDGWSAEVFNRELMTLYKAFLANESSPLPELPIQYADYAVWQRKWLQGDVLDGQLNYWQQQLAGIPPELELPMAKPRPSVLSYQGEWREFSLTADLSKKLKELSQQEGCTLYMTLLAAFNVLLYRYTGQDDIAIGTLIAGRTHRELENLIGLFVNTLLMRTRLSGELSFRQLLQKTRSVALAAYAHQDLPFEKLVQELNPERALNRNPLFQVACTLQNAPWAPLELSEQKTSSWEIDEKTAKFDLSLIISESGQGISGGLEYSTDLFEQDAIERMIGHLQVLLEGIVAEPDQQLFELPMLTEAERHQVLAAWNDTQTDDPSGKCIHELFEEQVERTPNAIAVVYEEQQLTYRELNQRANQLAHYLQELGVGPDVTVGIYVERSPEMVVGLLGILKAGGAYVPLDPEYPKERLAFMLADSQAAVVLTQARLRDELPEHKAEVICLDSEWERIAAEGMENPTSHVTTGNLAYVIYTSGSTGQPKGVLIAHQGLSNISAAQQRLFSISPADRVLQLASLNFDASAFEMIMALSSGAALHLEKRETLLPGPDFSTLLLELGITVMTITPSALSAVPVVDLPALRLISVAGEACPAELVSRWAGGRRFFNLYGPTEGTIWATAAELGENRSDRLHIGHPIGNMRTYILDGELQPVPVGVAGELHIAGIGLARGYLNRPELTAEKFVPNPFAVTNGDRLYKTGDLARWLPDGNIEYVGRIDQQVKIRGFRIELGEIESALSQHAAVREALVLVREDQPGSKRIVAYVVAGEAPTPSVEELRSDLKKKLPEYMLPAAFVFLEQLPLTPNGKVDRKALPAPDMTRSEVGYVAPRTSAEETLAEIWAEVLHVEKMGVYDSFFELGGHSLLVMKLIAKLKKRFAKEVTVSEFFRDPTIAYLANSLKKQDQNTYQLPIVEIQRAGTKNPFFCIHPVSGSTFCYTSLAHYFAQERSFYGLQAVGFDGKQELLTSVEEMATCYIDSVRSVQQDGPYLIGGWSMGGVIAFEMAQQLKRQSQEVAVLALIDSWAPTELKKNGVEDDAVLLSNFLENLVAHFGKRFSMSPKELDTINPDERLQFAVQCAKQAKAIPVTVGAEDVAQLFQVYRANIQALSRYSSTPSVQDIHLFRASEGEVDKTDHTLGWKLLTAGRIEVLSIPGDHFSMVLEPHIEILAEKLRRLLSIFP